MKKRVFVVYVSAIIIRLKGYDTLNFWFLITSIFYAALLKEKNVTDNSQT